ncbi:MAG TPA: hypothetical protein PLO69_05190 [Gammaproteobacteria bacterium]|nr:hypothetical protein [Gammaproteobacteria bacterium]
MKEVHNRCGDLRREISEIYRELISDWKTFRVTTKQLVVKFRADMRELRKIDQH